ncbi:MAG: glycosyl hydrolase family 18 protein [Acetivibrio ethanolgignens]
MNTDVKKKAYVGITLFLLVVLITGVAILIKKFAPNNEMVSLTDYYGIEGDELLIVLQDKVHEEKGFLIDGEAYIDYDTVAGYLNKRFYWDANENLLIYTTATEVIKAEVGSRAYYVNKSKTDTKYQIVKTDGDKVYVAADYVKLFSNLEYELYTEPNRIVLTYKWNQEYTYAAAKKKAKIRTLSNIKAPGVAELKKGDKVLYAELSEGEAETIAEDYVKVVTQDGIVGYVKKNRLGEPVTELLSNDYQEEEYPRISKDYKINLVWHQVTNMAANDGLLNLLGSTKGVTTVSPTWFSVANNKGAITSLASETYVTRAHNAGVEVWALCDDFDTKNVNMYELLSYTSRREKLENELIASAIKYNLDGINIDFEKITREAGVHFIQFIRELSVKCRSNGIVLSVDNYAPGYTAHYDRKEQGKVVDYVITMAYDEHTSASEESGSVASLGYVEKAIKDMLEVVPAEKNIIGVPFYTRIWREEEKDGKTEITSAAYGMNQAINWLADRGVEPKWSKKDGQYYAEVEENGAVYKVWLEEDDSIEAKMKLIDEAQVAGVAGWKLGLEKQSIWNVIVKYVN